jgi:glycosyltransferase involved in cell wall biosynthesis
MKKVIITSPSLNPNINVSGISAVTTFIIRNNPEYEYLHFELGKTDGQYRGWMWLMRNIKAMCLWFWLMIRYRNIVVHFNLALTMLSLLRDLPLIFIAKISNKKILIHVHGGDYLEQNQPPKWAAFFLKLMFSGKKPKIVLSQFEKELVIKRYNAKNVHVVPNCIDLNEAIALERIKNYELPLKLIFIGRIDRNKGLDYIYQALSILKEEGNSNFRFTIAGSGPDKEEFVNKFTNLLGTSFEYKGVVSGKEKTELLQNGNLFLLPSLFEGLPISLLENMSFGNVPVVTSVGSVGTVVTDRQNGLIVSKESAEEIAQAINTLLTDTSFLQQMSVNSRQFIFKNFDPNIYIEKLNSIYHELVNKKEIIPEVQPKEILNPKIKVQLPYSIKGNTGFFNYFKKHRIF